MKKLGLASLGILMTLQGAFALDCMDQVEVAAKKKLAKSLGTIPSYLKVEHVTGETLDGDTTSEGLYLTPSWEVVALYYADPKNTFDEYANSNPLVTYAVELYTYSDKETGEVVDCEIQRIDKYDN